MKVDLVVLSRDPGPLRADVQAGIDAQAEVGLIVHRLIGTPLPDDPNRWATIARARNRACALGCSPWVLLLDDDVVLGPGCVARLVAGLMERPGFAALAADSAGVMQDGWEHWDYPSHVGMAAVLFRRERLAEVSFRWEPDHCECLCCASDLRGRGQAIGYQRGALAWHRPLPADDRSVGHEGESPAEPATTAASLAPARIWGPGRILAAFDRRDHVRFRTQFLASLRACGNQETVWAFAYGLYPTELARLTAEPGVEVVAIPHDGVCPALRRLQDFQRLLERWPDDSLVAYWDAGDVLFQGRLDPLWQLVCARPGVLHAAREPLSYPENLIIEPWCACISDPEARGRAIEILSANVFLNSGFAAGTADAMLDYLREADRLLHSPALAGVGDWGDQPAMNLYCHANPDRWLLIDSCWNFALAGRPREQYRLGPDGRATRIDGGPVYVLHGNAATLRWLELAPPTASVTR
jgi:hypothetical protein